MTGHDIADRPVDRLTRSLAREVGHRRLRHRHAHPPPQLPPRLARAWPVREVDRPLLVRWPANAPRWFPARLWTARQRRQSATVRAVLAICFLPLLILAAAIAAVLGAAVMPVRVAVFIVDEIQIARGWRRPLRPAESVAEASAAQSTRLSELREQLTQPLEERLAVSGPQLAEPTGQIPPWVLSQPAGPGAEPPIVTAPHYVRVPPPASSRKATMTRSPAATAWLLFKVLALCGVLYVLALGCVISIGADRLADRQSPTHESDQ